MFELYALTVMLQTQPQAHSTFTNASYTWSFSLFFSCCQSYIILHCRLTKGKTVFFSAKSSGSNNTINNPSCENKVWKTLWQIRFDLYVMLWLQVCLVYCYVYTSQCTHMLTFHSSLIPVEGVYFPIIMTFLLFELPKLRERPLTTGGGAKN